MRIRRALLLPVTAVAAVLLGMAVFALPASAATISGDFTCPNGFLGVLNVTGNLTVPANSSCGLTQGSTIGNDVTIDQGGSFFIGGTTIGHDLNANHPNLIELGDPNNGTTATVIGHDVNINGTTGTFPFGEFICQTQIGHNLTVQGTAPGTTGWDIGFPEPFNCARNSTPGDSIAGDATFSNNAGAYLDVGDSTFGHDLTYNGNTGIFDNLTDNSIVHNCTQSNNHPYDGSGNTAGNSIDACNSVNA